MSKTSSSQKALIAIVGIYVAILVLAPLAALCYAVFGSGLTDLFGALARSQFPAAFGRTAFIAVVVVAVHAVFGTIVAWVLVRHRFPGRDLVNAAVDLPFAVSAVVVGYMFLLLFGRNGALGPVLSQLDIQIVFALPGMILATAFVTLPFMIRELIPVLTAFSEEQERAAHTLGAGGWLTFRRVTFPAIRRGFYYGVGLTFARALGEFGAVLVVGGGVVGRTDTATIFIYQALEGRKELEAYSAALLLGLCSVAVIILTEYLSRRKEEPS